MTEEARDAMRRVAHQVLPVGRLGEADDLAETYLYLLREGYSTGQVIIVDGGASLVSRPLIDALSHYACWMRLSRMQHPQSEEVPLAALRGLGVESPAYAVGPGDLTYIPKTVLVSDGLSQA